MLKGSQEFKRMMDNTADNEDVFPLVGRDKLAPGIVREWIDRAFNLGVSSLKLTEASECADRMEKRTDRKVPD